MSLFDVDDTMTVRQLSTRLNKMLRREFSSEIWVRGQIRNLSRAASGHVYFDLVEPVGDGEPTDAMIKGVLFRATREQVNRTLTRSGVGARIEDGMEIRIRAAVDWYPPSGSLQLKMSAIDPEYTLGRLAADRDQLMKRLGAEGLLAANGELHVPLVPLAVAVVTSDRSAAWADFEKTLNASRYAFSIRLLDSRMQGITAAESIARSIHLAGLGRPGDRSPDVVCVVRGGGARTDLAVFDSEVVARAIAACPVPVLCGIGHEIDRSVADEVAAISRKTPTACAQELIDRVRDADDAFAAAARRLAVAAKDQPRSELMALDQLHARVHAAPTRILEIERERAHRSATALQQHSGIPLAEALMRLSQAHSRVRPLAQSALARAAAHNTAAADTVTRTATGALQLHRAKLQSRDAQVRLLDPVNLLRRGWSITTASGGSIVRSVSEAQPGDTLTTRLSDGHLVSRIIVTTHSPPSPTTIETPTETD